MQGQREKWCELEWVMLFAGCRDKQAAGVWCEKRDLLRGRQFTTLKPDRTGKTKYRRKVKQNWRGGKLKRQCQSTQHCHKKGYSILAAFIIYLNIDTCGFKFNDGRVF